MRVERGFGRQVQGRCRNILVKSALGLANSVQIFTHFDSINPEASPFSTHVESVEDYDSLSDDLLRQSEEYSSSLSELRSSITERGFEVWIDAIELRACSSKLLWCDERVD